MKLRKFLLVLVALVLSVSLFACKPNEEASQLEAINDADAFEREDYTSVYDEFGADITIADVTEKADGSATITKNGKTYTLGLDFLSMAMVYNCTPAGSYTTEEQVYNQWWKLYIQRWNKVLPEIPLYSNQYYDVYDAKIDQFKTSPYWGPEEAVVGATSKDSKIILGNSTELSGLFRASAFGKSSAAASDQDIEQLTTGYGTVVAGIGGSYEVNQDVVKDLQKTVNADGTLTYTIEIKEGLKDSKNQEITADYYIAATIAANTPIYGAAGGSSSGSTSLVGYKEFLKYDGTNASAEGVSKYFEAIKKLSDYKWSVTVSPEYAGYYYSITLAGFSPKDPAIYLCGSQIVFDETTKAVGLSDDYYETETKDGAKVYKNAAKLAANIKNNSAGEDGFAYTGPYVVESYDESNKTAKLTKNQYYVTEDYRKFTAADGTKKDGNITEISYVKVVQQTQTDQLKAGEVNVLQGITGGNETKAALELTKDGKFKETHYDRAGYGKLSFKGDYGPTQFEAVRQAIAYTINRPQFADAFTGGYGSVVDGPYYSGANSYLAVKSSLKLNTYDYSVDKAKKLLEDNGWVYSCDGKKITDYTGSGVRYKKLAKEEATLANINYRSTDGAYKTVKFKGEYYMPLVINWYGTPADENEVTALLITNWQTAEAPKSLGFYITTTQGDFQPILYGQYYQMESYGYTYGDKPICSCANFATGYNSAVYDYSFSWAIDQELYWNYNLQLMDPADFFADYE